MIEPVDIPILFCDSALLVVIKPAGLSTLPDGYDPSLPHIKSLLEQQFGQLWIVHRLDKETSGVLLLARSAAAHRSLNTQFEQRAVSKIYHALVTGLPEWQQKTIDLPLKPNGDRQHRTVIDLERGKPAVTHLIVLERFEQHSLLEAIPETGRTHQIRAHLSAVGLFIVGDKLYARKTAQQGKLHNKQFLHENDPFNGLAKNMALHSISLEFQHPTSGEKMKFTAPYPPAFMAVLANLRNIPRVT